MIAVLWAHDLFYYGYQNDGVGNFTDDIIIIIFFGYFVKKATDAMKKRHSEQRAHEERIENAMQKLHDHFGTGHRVK